MQHYSISLHTLAHLDHFAFESELQDSLHVSFFHDGPVMFQEHRRANILSSPIPPPKKKLPIKY